MLNEKPTDYWSRPVRSSRGHRHFDGLYRAVGKALSEWEAVELVMARLFGVAVETESVAALQAYGLMQSPVVRSQALKRALATYNERHQDQDRHAEAVQLLAHYDQAPARRNECAHGIATVITDIRNRTVGAFLIPTPFASKRHIYSPQPSEGALEDNLPFDYAYVVPDLESFAARFSEFRRSAIAHVARYDADTARALSNGELPPEALPILGGGLLDDV